jgi:hypothetical protein
LKAAGMTIAACYVCSEGVVFGADSTWTVPVQCAGGEVRERYFAHGQKILQVGDNSTLGLIMWGLLVLKELSFRTIVARLADDLQAKPAQTIEEAASRWTEMFWREYTTALSDVREQLEELQRKGAQRSQEEDEELEELIADYQGGFCFGGYFMSERIPESVRDFLRPDHGHA